MSARDDYPFLKFWAAVGYDNVDGRLGGSERQQCVDALDEIDALRDYARRLRTELTHHGWGDFHYTPQGAPQDPAIVALLNEEHPTLG